MPVLTITPKRSRPGRLSMSIPLSATAVFAAAIARWVKRSVRRTSFGFLKNGFGSKSADKSADFAIEPGGIKCVDRVNATHAISQIRPKSFEIIAKRRDNTHTSDNYPAISHVIA